MNITSITEAEFLSHSIAPGGAIFYPTKEAFLEARKEFEDAGYKKIESYSDPLAEIYWIVAEKP